MFALPIIERELRVRARKPWTVWTRVLVGLLISLLAIETLRSSPAAGWGPAWRPGKTLFDAISALLFLLCLVEGVRQTADCLSKEKREGTLGLLFLTELRGFDVVVGKLVATSLGSFYILLAAFPAMAMALPAGGLTGGEFWRTQLVLLNTLFLAVAAGMWASARHHQEYRALKAGLGLVCALAVLPWMVEWPLRQSGLPNISPWVAMALADDRDYSANVGHFWFTLAATHALAWGLLVAAGRRVQASWRDEAEHEVAASASSIPTTPFITRQRIRAWRLVLAENPAAWLADRLPTHRGLIWCSILILTLSMGLLGPGFGAGWAFQFGAIAILALSWAFHFGAMAIPMLLLSFVATRSFSEARREGAMELLLSTPLSTRSSVEAHWQALWRQVSVPFWLSAGIVAYFAGMGWLTSRGFSGGNYSLEHVFWQLLPLVDRLVRVLAVCWLGLYLGLRMGSTTQAIGYCVLWTVGVPMVGTYLLWYILAPFYGRGLAGMGSWAQLGVDFIPTTLNIAYSFHLVAWAQGRLRSRFRELVAGG